MPFSYGHGYHNASCDFRTIMAVSPLTSPRINRWANPNIPYNGCQTGTTSTNNTARVWNERLSTLAAFRSPLLTVATSGPSKVCSPGYATVTASPQATSGCTLGTCTYGWSLSWCEAEGACPTPFYATGETGSSSTKYVVSTDVYVYWRVIAACNVTCSGLTTLDSAEGGRHVWGPAGFLCGGGF